MSKSFSVAQKDPGVLGSLRALIRPRMVVKQALQNVDLDVEPGEIVGLVGSNGAGKTTLIKILSGIIYPDSGEVSVLGEIPQRRKAKFLHQIALIMGQKAQLWWDLPAEDCFELLREIYCIEQATYRRRLDELSEVLNVREQLRVQIRRLSLGERMKMELIAALLHAPRVVFLDEPTLGLDLTAQTAIREFLLEYRKKYMPAMIVTSHYMEDIERLCERICVLRRGELVYEGSLAHVLERYANHKQVRVVLNEERPAEELRARFSPFGEIDQIDRFSVSLRVPTERLARFVADVLGTLEIRDLAVENADVAHVVERLIRSERGDEHLDKANRVAESMPA